MKNLWPILVGSLCLVLACQPTARPTTPYQRPFHQPVTPTFFIVVKGADSFYYQWGKADALHGGTFQSVDSAFHRYISLYKYPQLKVLIRGPIKRKELMSFYEELEKRDMLNYVAEDIP
ncbi:MAG: hypothetical protein AAFQ83_12965 [Bacteroidota bacterium]